MSYLILALGGEIGRGCFENIERLDLGEPAGIVAADSGYDRILAVRPDLAGRIRLLIGDFDSIKSMPAGGSSATASSGSVCGSTSSGSTSSGSASSGEGKDSGNSSTTSGRGEYEGEGEYECLKILRLDPIKDITDGEAALQQALRICKEEGTENLVILGFAGGRLDHALANIFMLYGHRDSAARCIAVGGSSIAELIGGERRIYSADPLMKYFSLIPLSDCVADIEGAVYSGRSIDLPLGSSRGISNQPAGSDKVKITVRSGHCLIIWSGDDYGN